MPVYTKYSLVVVDEISQLSGQHSDQIIQLWKNADCIPCLAIIGDKKQMVAPGEQHPWQTGLWKRHTFKTDFKVSFRFKKDKPFGRFLGRLRIIKANKQMMKELKKPSKRAWNPPGPPTPAGMRRLFGAHPNTEVLTCSRWGMDEVNRASIAGLFPLGHPLVTLPGDLETNPLNYHENKLKPDGDLKPLDVNIYKGM
jgi:hypothetical protein